MLKKITMISMSAILVAALGYTAMAYTVVIQSQPTTVLTLAASDRLPFLARGLAEWRVQSWDGCPNVNRGLSPLGQTLRGYGLDGFDNKRVLETASHLLAIGCDPNALSPAGQTAMHEAVLYNEPEVVSFLLANGADPSVVIDVPDDSRSATLRHYSGMDARTFALELDSRSHDVNDRARIITLLSAHST